MTSFINLYMWMLTIILYIVILPFLIPVMIVTTAYQFFCYMEKEIDDFALEAVS